MSFDGPCMGLKNIQMLNDIFVSVFSNKIQGPFI